MLEKYKTRRVFVTNYKGNRENTAPAVVTEGNERFVRVECASNYPQIIGNAAGVQLDNGRVAPVHTHTFL